MRRPIRILGAVTVAGGLGLSACSTAALSNQSVSVCFRAIPVGRSALHDTDATMVGVHKLSARQVSSHVDPQARAVLTAEGNPDVCAMTFKGQFGPGQVDAAPTTEQGQYAVVLVTASKLKLLASAVTDTAPRGFGGRTVG